MGGTSSTNETDTLVNQIVNAINNVISQNSTKATAVEGFSLSNIVDSKVTISNFDFNEAVTINQSSLQMDLASEDVRSNISNIAEQTARTIAQSLNLDPGSARSNNLIMTAATVADNMVNSYQQTCQINVVAQEIFALKNIKNSSVDLKFFNFEESLQSTEMCVLNDQTVSTAVNDFQQQVDQAASTERKGLFDFLIPILIVLGIAAIVFLFFFFKGSSGSARHGEVNCGEGPEGSHGPRSFFNIWNILFLGAIILMIISGLLVLGFFLGWWPYKNVPNNSSVDVKSAVTAYNKRIFIASIVAFVVFLIATGGLYIFHHRSRVRHHDLVAAGVPPHRCEVLPADTETHHYYENSHFHEQSTGRIAPLEHAGGNVYTQVPGQHNPITPHQSINRVPATPAAYQRTSIVRDGASADSLLRAAV